MCVVGNGRNDVTNNDVPIHELVARLSDDNMEMQTQARTILYQREGELTLLVLLAMLEQRHQPTRMYALHRFGALGDSVSFDALLAALHDPADQIRETVAGALGLRQDRRAVEPLLAVLAADHAALVRQSAVDALARLGDDRALPCLVAALNDDDIRVQVRASWAVAAYGSAAVQAVIAILQDHTAAGRRWAAVALGRLTDARAMGPLLAALHDPDVGVRASAAQALHPFAVPDVEDALIAALHDPDGHVRWAAAGSLAHVGTSTAVEPLIHCLDDPWRDVWGAAATALGTIGDTRAVDPLIARMAQRDDAWFPTFSDVAVIEALGQLRDPHALPVLVDLQQSDMEQVETDEEPLRLADVAAKAIDDINETHPSSV